MPHNRIAPPQLPEYSAKEVAVMLPPMPIPPFWIEAIWIDSDAAMRLSIESGVAIRSDYVFRNSDQPGQT